MQRKRNNGTIVFAYSGASMWPLFQEGDLLTAKRVRADHLRIGDCIIFQGPKGKDSFIVHRVSAVKPQIRTRADRRGVDDDAVVHPACILGRVTARIRAGRTSKVHGGPAGRWIAKAVWFAGLIDPSRNAKGGRIARAIQRLLAPFSAVLVRRAKAASFMSPDGQSRTYLIIQRRVIGVYDEETRGWRLSWPYCLCLRPADVASQHP